MVYLVIGNKLIVGDTGTGKTSMLVEMLKQVKDQKVIVVDGIMREIFDQNDFSRSPNIVDYFRDVPITGTYNRLFKNMLRDFRNGYFNDADAVFIDDGYLHLYTTGSSKLKEEAVDFIESIVHKGIRLVIATQKNPKQGKYKGLFEGFKVSKACLAAC